MPPDTAPQNTSLPPGVKVVSAVGMWAGPDPTAAGNQYDVLIVGSDGVLYKKTWSKGFGWTTPEVIS